MRRSRQYSKDLITTNEQIYRKLQERCSTYARLTTEKQELKESIAETEKEIESHTASIDLLEAFKGRSDRTKLMRRIQERAENELRITKEYSEHQAQIKDLENELKKREKENKQLQEKFESMLSQLEDDVNEGTIEKELQHQYNSFLNRANACIRMKHDRVEASLKANECDVSHFEFLAACLGDNWRDHYSKSEGTNKSEPSRRKSKKRSSKTKPDPRRQSQETDSDHEPISSDSTETEETMDTTVVIPDCLKTASAAIRQEQISLENRIARIHEEVSGKAEKMADLDDEITSLSRKVTHLKSRQEEIIQRMKITGQICKITVKPATAEKKDQGVNCRTLISLDDAKRKIAYNTNTTQKRFMRQQQKGELEQSLIDLRMQLEAAKERNNERESEKQSLIAKLLKIVPDSAMRELLGLDIDDVSRKLEEKRSIAEDQLQTLDEKLAKAESNYKRILNHIADVRHISSGKRKELASKGLASPGKIRQLCSVLKNYRQEIRSIAKRASFQQIISDRFDEMLATYNDQFSEETLKELTANNDILYSKLHAIKQKFNTLRAIREKRSIVLTNEEEMGSLQLRITELSSELDVFRMRMNGVASRVDKLVRLVQQADIPVPER